MAKIRIAEVVDFMDTDMRTVLKDTLTEHFPGVVFDDRQLFRTFKKRLSDKCDTWELVPDQYVLKSDESPKRIY